MEDKARNIPSSQFKLFSIFREESFPIRSFDKVYMYLAFQTLKASMPTITPQRRLGQQKTDTKG
jgi:hypothetical protein